MLLSKLVCERMKEVPQDAKLKSHVLLVRAGFIKQVAGVNYKKTQPGQKTSPKIQNIIREEMDAEDGQEVLFPVVMTRELWEQSGRYASIGQEMVRFKDRGDRDMLLGMTHEEAAVHLANHTVSSYQQLPMMIYQLQTKFRDEARPRGGLIRVREFTMKDAYSFHCDNADLEKYYYRMYDAYYRIFRRIGLKNFIDVKSDSGMMGGSVAHEFMLITPDGEDSIVFCNDCDYRANMEVAVSVIDRPEAEDEPMREIYTGEDKTIEEVCARLNIPASRTVKAVVYAVKGDSDELVVAFIRGDLEVNEAKLKKVLGKNVVAYDGGISEDIVCGNIGAIGLSDKIVKVFDKSLEGCKGMVTGANKPEYHIAGVNVARDFGDVTFVDVAKAAAGHRCPVCGGTLRVENGIEIGNIFQLGTKYTASMNMTVNGPDGTAFNPIMGCYGIGVGRAIGSIAQESNDEYGLILPMSVAPWQVHICALRYDDDAVRSKADKLYADLRAAGVEVLFDDRNCGAGVKFADADLMGMPIRVVISPKTLAEDKVEIKLRREKTAERVDLSEAVSEICRTIEKELEALK